VSVDPALVGYVSFRRHRICNPYSLEQLERVLDFADLERGDRAVDIGCGNGVATCWMARAYGLQMTGLERFALVAAMARDEADEPMGRGEVTILEGPASAHLSGTYRLVSAIGAIDVFPGVTQQREAMARLAAFVEPGGWLLWGDPFWKRPPTPAAARVFGAETYESLLGWTAAGEAAGLAVRHVAVSAEAEWERFFWTMNASMEDWAAEQGTSPEADAIRARAAMLRKLYLEEQRDSMGFGLYLFRKPT
jgi:SAM-dependent methyltransferase